VTNRSNRAVACTLTYDKNASVTGVDASLTNSSYTLASAVGATEGSLPKEVSTVSMSGSYTGRNAVDAGYLLISIVPADSTTE
jgi:hypothetical protein